MLSNIQLPQNFQTMPGGDQAVFNALTKQNLENQAGNLNNQVLSAQVPFAGSNALYNNQILGTQAKYAPLTSMADAASKLTYSNLMGPQFLAKVLNNPNLLANLPDAQKKQLLGMVTNAGTSSGINSLMNMVNHPSLNQNNNYLMNSGNDASRLPSLNSFLPNANNSSTYNPNDYRAQSIQNNNALTNNSSNNSDYSPNKTFAENTGSYKGSVAEGEEAGKLRASDINDLSTQYQSAVTKQSTLDDLSDIIKSPLYESIRQLPLAQQHEISWYSKFGTPEQQNMIGRFYTDQNQIIKDASQDFKGQFRRGEQGLLSQMKVNPSDMPDVARGKMQSLNYFNQMMIQRSKLAADLMQSQHINKADALEQADKKINADGIRKQIYNQVNPAPTDDDINFMAKKYNVSPDVIRQKLKAKGIG